MSRFYRTDDEQRGYDQRKEEGRYSSYPYQENHDYRIGWDDAARDERRTQERKEEAREEEAAAERQAERRHQELAEERRIEEEALHTQQEPIEPQPPIEF